MLTNQNLIQSIEYFSKFKLSFSSIPVYTIQDSDNDHQLLRWRDLHVNEYT